MALFTLLIGINKYHPTSAVTPLSGCQNDVQAVREFLLKHFSTQGGGVLTLINEQATRANVVAAFRDHLGQAGPGDTVLIYYSGHGSQNTTAVEFQSSTPDKREEGWVLYDSRLPGNYDLADKEIALLLETLGRRNPEIVVVADSCHSGSVTRSTEDFKGWKPRFIPGSKEPRPLESYLDGAYLQYRNQRDQLEPPRTRQILFSACANSEVAWESDEKCGVFTRALIEILDATKGHIRYADVYTRLCAAIRNITRRQNPQAEVFGGFNPNSGFLGKPAPSGANRRYAVYFDPASNNWNISAGAADGIRTDTNTRIPVRLFDAEIEGNASGEAFFSYIGPAKSRIEPVVGAGLNPLKNYWGELNAIPLVPLFVFCPDPATRDVVETTLKGRRETAITFCARGEESAVVLLPENGNLVLRHPENRGLIHGVTGASGPSVEYILETLDHLAHWHRIRDLENRRSRLSPGDVPLRLELQQEGAWKNIDGENITLSFRGERIDFRVSIANRSSEPLYMALVYLNPRFQMSILWESSTQVPEGSADLYVFKNYFHLPGNVEEELDTLKLIVSTEKIQPTAFSRPELPPQIVSPEYNLMKGGTRSIGGLSEPGWFTRSLNIRLLRDSSDGVVGAQTLSLAGGQVEIASHEAFRSGFALASPAATRGLDAVRLDAPFFARHPKIELLSWDSTRDAGASFLDLSDIRSDAALARDPLEIRLAPHDPDSLILPFWFDGENFVPAGETLAGADGALRMLLHQVPDESQVARTRSLGKALRLFCFKFAKDYGLPLHTQFLRRVTFAPDGSPERSDAGLRAAVTAARKIVVLVHGIIGDTEYMAKAFRDFAAQPDHLVLTFDYENLNTSLENTALTLKNKLLEAGIGPDDGKELVVVAQSMGGLVARYLVEHLDGDRFVDRMVLTGTPNAGSRLGNVSDYINWACVMMGLGMRYFSWSLPALAGFVGALQFARDKMFVTLDQLKPGSDFLALLAAGGKTPIPYHIIAGDIDVFLQQENDPGFMVKALAQTGRLFYGAEANDGAVSVASICAVPGATMEVVPGHHYGYYENQM